jgi:hypothetical protein
VSDRPPSPFVPPVPVADGGGGGGEHGTPRRWVVVGGGILVALIVLVALVAGGDDGSDVDPERTPGPEVVQGAEPSVPGFTDTDEGFADGGDIEDLLADVSAEEERCLRAKIADGIEEGSFTEAQAMGEVLGYLEECGIPPEELFGEG